MINFESFARRMWLDNCDENKAFGSKAYTYEEYFNRYEDYLKKKFKENKGQVNEEIR
jgi:hypothetical protein